MPARLRFDRDDAADPIGPVLGALVLAVALAALPRTAWAQSAPPAQPAGGKDVPGQIVGAFDSMFAGPHAGQRAVHAKGVLCEGVFIPTPDGRSLSRAAHLQGAPVPVLARFSNFAALPGLPDGHAAASPRGLAIKFLLADGGDTDIVAHSYDGFPARTPEEFLAFLRAVPDPAALTALAATRPAARAFLDHPKPTPASYGTESFFGVSALRFTDAGGATRHGRYRLNPLAEPSHLAPEEAAGRAPGFLAEELAERMRRGPVVFRLTVQLAGEGDDVTDGTVPWPADRPIVELGLLSLGALVPSDDGRHSDLTFVPTNLVGGIAPSADPMLAARTQGYRISAERRSHAR